MSTTTAVNTVQYLTFKLEEEVYATDIAQVQEVLEYTRVTKVPRTPEYMRGVINLRGHVVPVLDLKLRFGMNRTEQTVNTCVIILNIDKVFSSADIEAVKSTTGVSEKVEAAA